MPTGPKDDLAGNIVEVTALYCVSMHTAVEVRQQALLAQSVTDCK